MLRFDIQKSKREKDGREVERTEYAISWGKNKPDKKQEEKSDFEKDREFLPVKEIASNRLDQPKFVRMKNGSLAYGTDEGFDYKEKNEDRIVIDTENQVFGVIDGMGSYGNGERMAEIMAGNILKGAQRGASFEDIQKSAHKQMNLEVVLDKNLSKEERRKFLDGGVCYIAFKLEGNRLSGAQAGDVRLLVLRDGKIVFETVDQGQENIVYNSVSAKKEGSYSPFEFDLQPGDRVVTLSDGVTDNFLLGEDSRKDFVKEISKRTLNETMEYISDKTKEKMLGKDEEGKPDNRSALIFDFKPVEGDGDLFLKKLREKEESSLEETREKLFNAYKNIDSKGTVMEKEKPDLYEEGLNYWSSKEYEPTFGDKIWAVKTGLKEFFTGKTIDELPPSVKKKIAEERITGLKGLENERSGFEADQPVTSEEENLFLSGEFKKNPEWQEKQNERIRRIRETGDYGEIERIMIEEVIDFLKSIQENGGFSSLSGYKMERSKKGEKFVKGDPLGREYTISLIGNSVEFDEFRKNNPVILEGSKKMRRNRSFNIGEMRIDVELEAFKQFFEKDEFIKIWDNSHPYGKD